MNLSNEIEKVNTKEDFLRFLELLIEDYRLEKDSWENKDLGNYLEAMYSWIEDMEGYFEYIKMPAPQKVDWKFFANVLIAATIYE